MEAGTGGHGVRLVLDHHYPAAIARGLRERGFDAATVLALQWHELSDEALLSNCAAGHLVLLTNNVADFSVIVRQWQLEGRSHAGLIFTSDAARPRTRAGAGAYISALAELMHDDAGAWTDRVHWL